jgi:tetratricopeptide (TPR) repeat protein
MMIVRLGHFGPAMALVVALATQPGVSLAQGLNTGQGAAGGGVGGRGMGGSGGDELPGSTNGMRYDPVAEYKHGLADLQAGKFTRADNEFGHALQADPANADTLYMRGKAKTGEGDLKGAEKFYEKALGVDALKISALRESALTLAKLGQADKAQARLAVLKASNTACGGTCPQASALNDAVAAVQAALGPAPTAAAN